MSFFSNYLVSIVKEINGETNGITHREVLDEFASRLMLGVSGPTYPIILDVMSIASHVIDEEVRDVLDKLHEKANGAYLEGVVDQVALESMQDTFVRLQSHVPDEMKEADLAQEARNSSILYGRYLEAWKVAVAAQFQERLLRKEIKYMLEEGGMDKLMRGYISVKTEIGGSRYEELASHLLERAEAESLPLSVLYADVDDFKRLNEGFSHAVGDIAITHYAHVFHEVLRRREGDVLFVREGGEEISVYLLGMGAEKAAEAANEARERLQNTPMYIISPACENPKDEVKHPEPISIQRVHQLGISDESTFENVYWTDEEKGVQQLAGKRLVIEDPRNHGSNIAIRIISLEASVGVTELDSWQEGQEALDYIERGKAEADAQQKIAKQSGKNCVVVNGKRWHS